MHRVHFPSGLSVPTLGMGTWWKGEDRFRRTEEIATAAGHAPGDALAGEDALSDCQKPCQRVGSRHGAAEQKGKRDTDEGDQ
jgi:hypothetical protein